MKRDYWLQFFYFWNVNSKSYSYITICIVRLAVRISHNIMCSEQDVSTIDRFDSSYYLEN